MSDDKRSTDKATDKVIVRRGRSFLECLTYIVIFIAGAGGMYVLIDPVLTVTIGGQSIKIGGDGFAEQMKGAVIQTLLIGGWTTALAYWLGASKQGQESAQAVSQIAVSAAPSQAAAVAAARSEPAAPIPPTSAAPGPIVADTVEVTANNATLTEKDKP